MLEPTKTVYEQEKKSVPTNAAVEDDMQDGVDKLSLEEKAVPSIERSKRNEEMRNARLRFYDQRSSSQPSSGTSGAAPQVLGKK